MQTLKDIAGRTDPAPKSNKPRRWLDERECDSGCKHGYSKRVATPEEHLAYRLLYANMLLPECVEVNPNKRGGIPVLRGTRFTVAQILAEISDGRSVHDLCKAFDLDEELVVHFLQALSIYLDRPAPVKVYGALPAR